MSTLSIRLPDSLHKNIKKLSKKEQISINQFITNAVTEKITALETERYLQERAKKGNLDTYLSVLDKVKDTEADDFDK
jgi:predicted DNA-binding protein